MRALATYSLDTHLFDDPYAEYFMPRRYGRLAKRKWLHKRFARRSKMIESHPRFRIRRQGWRFMTQVVLRGRYTEDVLQRRISEGVKQYIILGAGMDTFVFRHKDLLSQIKVFELDLPSTQQFKLKRIQQAQLEVPPNVVYLPIDFEKSSVVDVLKQSDFNAKLPTVICWNGVTYYLPKSVIATMLRDLSDFMGSNVDIIFDYADGRFFNRKITKWWQKLLRKLYHSTPEPLITGFFLDELETFLDENGFTMVEHWAGKEMGDLYSQEVYGILQPSKYVHFAHIRGKSCATEREGDIHNVA